MNVMSIVLGLISLAFSVYAFRTRGCLFCCTGSLLSCGLALLCQLGELYRLTQIGDTAAIYDTAHARVLAASTLLALTAGLHLWALVRRKQARCP